MTEFLTFILGAIGGFVVHSISMKVNFKQRTIDNKIKVYDSLISHWVRVRNYIYANFPKEPNETLPINIITEYDQIYGESQTWVAEAVLLCEDLKLTDDINTLNEKMYRTEWNTMTLDQANTFMEEIKVEALEIVGRMREDIKQSTIFELSDFYHICSGFRKETYNKKVL